jgi:hypothetical protein
MKGLPMHASLRVAGWATLAYAIAFLVTFVVNATVSTLIDFPEYPLATEMQAMRWDGILFLSLWGSAGVALVVAAPALSAVVWPDGGLPARIATSFGAIAAGGWMFSGCAAFAQRTELLNGNIAAVGADPEAERAVIEGLFALVHVGGVLFAFAAAPWLGMVAFGAAHHTRMSRTSVGLLWVAGIAPLLVFLVSGFQFGFLATMLALGVTGTLLLRRARRVPAEPAGSAARGAGA